MKKIIKIIAQIKDVSSSEIKPSALLVEDLSFTSLDFAVLWVNIEEIIDVQLEMKIFVKIKTVEELEKYVNSI